MTLQDISQGKMLFIYLNDNLCLFFSPNRVAQLRLVPPEQRQNVMHELCRRFAEEDQVPAEKSFVTADLVVWDILRENGWAFKPREKPSNVYTTSQLGDDELTE